MEMKEKINNPENDENGCGILNLSFCNYIVS